MSRGKLRCAAAPGIVGTLHAIPVRSGAADILVGSPDWLAATQDGRIRVLNCRSDSDV